MGPYYCFCAKIYINEVNRKTKSLNIYIETKRSKLSTFEKSIHHGSVLIKSWSNILYFFGQRLFKYFTLHLTFKADTEMKKTT